MPTIFQVINSAEVLKYLKHSIEKAVGYLSEVISDDNLAQITDALKYLTVYLDTNTVYRLLDLQGEFRYEAIKNTLDFCRKSGVKLKVSALTKKELSSRLQYDAQVLMKFPARANLSNAGYKYRTSEDHDAKEKPPVVITPSQLLQMFAFSKADSGYEETFIKFFASSSVGVSFEYNNNDIQEILSRIGHYNGVSSEVAERILARQIVQSRYTSATDDEEKEEIIYKTVSEELLKELDLTKEQVAALELEKNHLNDDRKAALDLLTENDELFEGEKKKLQAEAEEARKRHAEEADARQQAEQDRQRVKKYSERQEQLYIDEKMKVWKRKHWILLIIGAGLTLTVIVAALLLWKKLNDSGCLGLLGLLTVTIPITIKGGGVLSVKSKSEARQELLDNYRERLKT